MCHVIKFKLDPATQTKYYCEGKPTVLTRYTLSEDYTLQNVTGKVVHQFTNSPLPNHANCFYDMQKTALNGNKKKPIKIYQVCNLPNCTCQPQQLPPQPTPPYQPPTNQPHTNQPPTNPIPSTSWDGGQTQNQGGVPGGDRGQTQNQGGAPGGDRGQTQNQGGAPGGDRGQTQNQGGAPGRDGGQTQNQGGVQCGDGGQTQKQ